MIAPKGYSATQIALHWVIAVLVVGQLVFGEEIGDAFDKLRDTGIASYELMTIGHIAGGSLILALALWRLALRFKRGVPEVPHAGPAVLRRVAEVAHWLLYALMIGAPITGLVAWFGGGIASAAELHELAKPAFILLILGHTAAALWHQFWLKDGLLNRMRRPQD
jgi:cytochrome b561